MSWPHTKFGNYFKMEKTFDFISFYTDKHPFVIVWISISQAVNDKTLYEDMNTTERGCKSVSQSTPSIYLREKERKKNNKHLFYP